MSLDEILKEVEGDDPEAQYELGESYAYGQRGLDQDFEQAVYWYREAAKQENAEAQYDLALMILQGLGTERNVSQAEKWLKKAEQNGFRAATKKLKEIEKWKQFVSSIPKPSEFKIP